MSLVTYPLLAQLQNDVDVLGVVEEAVELDDVLVVQRLVYGDLLRHLVLLVLLGHLFLGDDLAGERPPVDRIHQFVAFRKATLKESRTTTEGMMKRAKEREEGREGRVVVVSTKIVVGFNIYNTKYKGGRCKRGTRLHYWG